MGYEHILFGIEGGIARLTLNRPDRLNSFNDAMHAEVRDALSRVRADTACRVLLITGAGRGFCAGQDLSDRAVAAGDAPVDLGASIERNYKPLVLGLRALAMPVICAVNGVAAGAGANLAFACDIVIAAKSASFIEAFSKLGLIPDTGGTYFLPRLAGTARAMGMAMLGEKISAEEIENLALSHPAVLNVACVPIPDPDLGERMCACVMLRAGHTLTLKELVDFLFAKEIAKFKLPERLEVLGEFPVSAFGKVSKKALVEMVARKLAQETVTSDR